MQFYSYFSAYPVTLSPLPDQPYLTAESNCPNSYVYAFDEQSGTALWTCDSNLNVDYTITFCP